MRWIRMAVPGIIALAAVASLPAIPVHAQGWIEANGVVRERTSVSVRVRNQIATVEVEEWFRNRGGNLGEGDYLYPLPTGAVFTSYSLFQGDKEMRGEVLDANEARRIYEDIVRRKKDPALIELVGHGLVRARVFPIGAGETRRVVLRYTQPLSRAGDALEFRYPANRAAGNAPVNFTLTAENAGTFRDAVSPTHEVSVRRERGQMVVRPTSTMQSDFALLLPLSENAVGITMSTQGGSSSDDGYFMLRLSPGAASAASRVARDVTVVVDVSGSMRGEKLEQAKSALRQSLGTLGTDDRFRLIKFSSASDAWRDDWAQASSAEIRAAGRWVDNLRADGGTNIGDALRDAFNTTSSTTRLSVVVFMTDGVPSVGEQNPERLAMIAERDAGRTRVFAFGVGQDVNTYLLDRLGASGRGSAQYVQPGESVETALGTLATKIQYPVLTDLIMNATGVTLREVYPGTLPDLFAGEDLVVFGRYRGASGRGSNGVIMINGRRSGRVERYSTRVSFAGRNNGNDYIEKLWASRKLGELTRRVRLEGQNSELIEEIRATALRYGLLSEYTSYFVAEPGAADLASLTVRGSRNPLVPRDQVSSRSVAQGNVAAAPPPATTGASAVASAESDRLRREATTVDQLAKVEKAALQFADAGGAGAGGGAGSTRKVVAGRTFALRAGIWESVQEASVGAAPRVVDVVAYSDAYFAVLRALPELVPYTALGNVSVAGRQVTIRLLDKGVSTLSDAEIVKITQQFRGPTTKP
ncbi:MAG: VIT domain-containing protein [Longimicrobiales bacterium]